MLNLTPRPPRWAPGSLADGGGRSRRAWWLVLLLLPLALLPLLGGAGGTPERLSDAVLVGPRSKAPIDLVVLVDDSGSFDAFRPIRDSAVSEVVRWAPGNLHPGDRLTIISFAARAMPVLPPTTISELSPTDVQWLIAQDGSDTLIQPPLELAIEQLGDGGTRSLIVVTDTMVDDALPSTLDVLTVRLGVQTMSTIIPVGVPRTAEWDFAFPYSAVLTARTDSVDSVSIAIAEAIAHATGQKVERR